MTDGAHGDGDAQGTGERRWIMHVQDGQYHVNGTYDVDDPWPGSADGLFVGEAGWVAVLCGTCWGSVDLTVRCHAQRPPVAVGWEMAAEWTLECPDRQVGICDLYSEYAELVSMPATLVRVRVSVRGRAQAAELPEFHEPPVEYHLHEYWPVSTREDSVLVLGPDEVAKHHV